MFPQTIIQEKLDTETIYSFLNEFQDTYVKQLYLAQDQAESKTTASNKINDILGTFISTQVSLPVPVEGEDNCEDYILPDDYMQYIRSVSTATQTYKTGYKNASAKKMANTVVSNLDINQFIESFCNQGGILRNPIAVVHEGDALRVYHDSYTKIIGVAITYMRKPHSFNIIGYDDSDESITSTWSCCELPFSCFDDLVSGAVQLYVTNYKMMTQRAAQQPRERRKEQEAE